MTQENKQLLLKDLCARLPYNVMVDYDGNIYVLNEIDPACKDIDYITVRIQDVERLMYAKSIMIENIKPYLRPMSSMTEEEKNEVAKLGVCYDGAFHNDVYDVGTSMEEAFLAISWLIERHFDINYLINKGLALEAKEGMYKNE